MFGSLQISSIQFRSVMLLLAIFLMVADTSWIISFHLFSTQNTTPLISFMKAKWAAPSYQKCSCCDLWVELTTSLSGFWQRGPPGSSLISSGPLSRGRPLCVLVPITKGGKWQSSVVLMFAAECARGWEGEHDQCWYTMPAALLLLRDDGTMWTFLLNNSCTVHWWWYGLVWSVGPG